MKLQHFEEQYKTCILLSRACFYNLCGDDEELEEKIVETMDKWKLFDYKNKGAFWGRRGAEYGCWPFTDLLHFPNSCWIFKIPGFRTSINASMRKMYQLYCNAFAWLTPEDIEKITQAAIDGGDNFAEYGRMCWEKILEERRYIPVISDFRNFFYYLVHPEENKKTVVKFTSRKDIMDAIDALKDMDFEDSEEDSNEDREQKKSQAEKQEKS